MRTRILFLVVLVGAALCGPALPAQAVVGTITGTVTGPGGGALAGVEVHAWSDLDDNPGVLEDRGSTTTDGSGHYSLPVDVSPVILCFRKTGYVTECNDADYQSPFEVQFEEFHGTPVTVPAEGATVDASMIAGASVSGTASTEDGPIANGTVVATTFNPLFVETTTTDANGDYALSHLPPGTYRLCVSAPTVIQRCTDSGLPGPTAYALEEGDDVTTADLTIAVSRPHTNGLVRTAATAVRWTWQAVPGASDYRVALSSSPTMSNPKFAYPSTNQWAFTGLTKGRAYYVAVRAEGPGVGGGKAVTAASPVAKGVPGVVNNLHVSDRTDRALKFHWTQYLSAGTSYEIWLSQSPTFSPHRSEKAIAEGYPFVFLSPGHPYYAKVRAIYKGKVITGWSAVVKSTPLS